ncbi:MAG: hypothetical protein COB66_03475 [Coxiella sp. (in: Bacteria)]|nr:MAG: hypothetical protein COB66_03475 [Coxiella sp. (in: g-proteobacteria)]
MSRYSFSDRRRGRRSSLSFDDGATTYTEEKFLDYGRHCSKVSLFSIPGNNQKYAVKYFSHHDVAAAEKEADFWRKRYPKAHVAVFHNSRELRLAMPMLPNQSYLEAIRKVTTLQALVELIRALVTEIEALHDLGVIHCDLKALNLMVGDDGKVCACDFGNALMMGDPVTLFAGPPRVDAWRYLPPEQHKDTNKGPIAATPELDIFAVGSLLEQTLCYMVDYPAFILEFIEQSHKVNPQERPLLAPFKGQLESCLAEIEAAHVASP